MSGNNYSFLNTLFRKESQKSTSKSTSDKDKVVTANLDNKSYMQLKQMTDYLMKLNNTVENMYKGFMGYSSSKTKKEKPVEPKTAKEDKSSKGTSTPSKQKQKKVDKSQKKVNKKLETKNRGEGIAKALNSLFKIGKDISKNILKNLEVSKAIRDLSKDSMDLAGKSITSSSVLIDKNLRSMQLGMGLSNQDAIGLSKSMKMLDIDKGDLAYLTEGQRDALNEMTGMFDKLYNSVDLTSISKLGNDIFMLQNKYAVLLEAIETHIMDAMTVLDPLIEYASEILDQLFDMVNEVFNSPEFKTLVSNVGLMVQDMLTVIKPIIEEVLSYVKEILPQIIATVNNLLVDLMPVVMDILSLIQPILEVVMNVVKPLLNIITTFLTDIIASVVDFINFLTPVITELVSSIGEFIVALMPVVNMIMTLVSNVVDIILSTLQPIISMIAESVIASLDIITPILQFLEPVFNFISQVLEFLAPVIVAISNVISKIMSWFMKVFDFLLAIRNAIVFWDKKNREDYTDDTPELKFNVENNTSVTAKSGIAKTYTPSNNTTSISNKATEIKIDATYNQSISGTASAYAGELAKQNYESNQVLSELVQGAL